MKALVTGTAGFIGSHLSERLIEAGHEVVGLDAFTDYYARSIKETNIASLTKRRRFRFIENSIAQADFDDVLDGVTHIFHLAAQAGVRKSWGTDFSVYTELNIDATQCLLEACVNRRIESFVYASSSSVYGDAVPIPMLETARPAPLSPYGVTKLAAEHLCMLYHANYNVPTVAVRYFTVYGPRQRPDMAFHRFLNAIHHNEPLHLYGDGKQTRDFTFIEDAVAATIAAGERGVHGSVYNVGGGSRVSMNEILDVMAQCTGKTLNVQQKETQRGDMRDTFADTTRAKTDLGFTPRVILRDGILAEYQWLTSLSGTS
jgi:UDP-glucose 4-epimerase